MAYMKRGRGAFRGLSSASVGQRRPPPPVANNFVPGGKLPPHGANMPGPAQPQPQQPQQQQQGSPSPRPLMQAPIAPPPKMAPPSPQSTVQQQQPPPASPKGQQQGPPPPIMQQQSPAGEKLAAPPAATNTPSIDDCDFTMDTIDMQGPTPPKPWHKGSRIFKASAVQRKERARRRNVRLRKLIQPKSALVVLNEIRGQNPINITDSTTDNSQTRCVITIDGVEYAATGASKLLAKNAAAEEALKRIILNKMQQRQVEKLKQLKGELNKDENEVKMEDDAVVGGDGAATGGGEGEESSTTAPNTEEDDMPWPNVASFALHKLLSSWDATVTFADAVMNAGKRNNALHRVSLKVFSNGGGGGAGGIKMEVDDVKGFKRGKKMPDNAPLMNPIMLLNQMAPEAHYEEGVHVGNPPNTLFKIECKIDGKTFLGTGPSKKIARRTAAFKACKAVLGIQYSPQFLEMNGAASIDEDPDMAMMATS